MAITTRSNKSADVTSRSVPKEKNGKKFNRLVTRFHISLVQEQGQVDLLSKLQDKV